MADLVDLASEVEERQRAAALERHRRRPRPPVHDGLCATCCVCGGATVQDRDTCAACADRATEGG